jgi:hypothetical protein
VLSCSNQTVPTAIFILSKKYIISLSSKRFRLIKKDDFLNKLLGLAVAADVYRRERLGLRSCAKSLCFIHLRSVVCTKKSHGGYRACWITGLKVWGHNPECNSDQPSLSGPTTNTLMGLLDCMVR